MLRPINNSRLIFCALFALMSLQMVPLALAQDADDLAVYGFEVEKLLNLGSGAMATVLFFLTAAAYRRSSKKRLAYVALAFLLFAAKGFLTSTELFGLELSWVDPTASFLNFAILLSFFFGLMKK